MKSRKKLWRTLTVVFLTLAICASVLGEVAQSYAPAINFALKTSSYKIVTDESQAENTVYYPSDFDSPEAVAAYGREISELAEAEGMVLMKNAGGLLPLEKGTNISLVLQTAYNFSYGSSGSGAIDASKYTDLKTALENGGFRVNSTLWDFYAANPSAQAITYSRKGDPIYKVNALGWDSYTAEAQASVTECGGVAIAVIGRLGGEGADVSAAKSDGYDGSFLSLTKEEISVLAELTQKKQAGEIKGIVVLINTALVFETAFLDDNWTVNINGSDYTLDVDACLWVGNVGIGGVNAIVKALNGEVNPSGHLPDTYVKDNFSSPAAASWALTNASGTFAGKYQQSDILSSDMQARYGVYTEGIYVGYRYYETRYEDTVCGRENTGAYVYTDDVSRPFGYGLSYTQFTQSGFSVQKTEGGYTASVTVTNTGSVPGKDVVQIYIQKPYTEYDAQNGVEKAAVELAGYAKTSLLAPGESETLTVKIDDEAFKTYDANGYKTYIIEAGDYYIAAGANAHDALNNILALKGKTVADGMDYDGAPEMAALVGTELTLDTTTYAVSSETGAAITNQLDFADVNKYSGSGDNTVTYVSRNNWQGTFPQSAVSLTATAQMAEELKSMLAVTENEADTVPAYGAAGALSLIMLKGLDYDDPLWDELLDEMSWEEQQNLVMLAGYGTRGAPSIGLPEIKAEDGPTGVVDSKESISFPSEGIWAASFNTQIPGSVGDALAEDARNCGVTQLYLPGVNIHRAPFGGRAHEYFSEDPYLTGISVENEVKGLQSKGVIPFVKHYVFNDQEDNRIGIGIWLNEQSAREIYLRPFEYAVTSSKGGAKGVMSSFNRAGCVWTSNSEALINTILRGEFGFDGVVITDMALGQNSYMSYDAVMNGTDLFLDPTGAKSQFDSYAESASFRTAVRGSVKRYLYTVVNSSADMNGLSSSSTIVAVSPWWQTTIDAVKYGCMGIGIAMALLLMAAMLKERKAK